jgi:hypothetical protein
VENIGAGIWTAINDCAQETVKASTRHAGSIGEMEYSSQVRVTPHQDEVTFGGGRQRGTVGDCARHASRVNERMRSGRLNAIPRWGRGCVRRRQSGHGEIGAVKGDVDGRGAKAGMKGGEREGSRSQ